MSRRKSTSSINIKENSNKRFRQQHSCGECHRRKQKCNRQIPCQHCVVRGLPFLCSRFEPEKQVLTTEERLTQLEGAVKSGFEAVITRIGPSQQSPSSVLSDMSLRGQTDLDNVKVKEVDPDTFEPLTTIGSGSSWSVLREHLDDGTAQESTLNGSAVPLFKQLPENTIALLDFYFQQVNWMMMPMPEGAAYSMLSGLLKRGPQSLAEGLDEFAMLFAIMALALYTCPKALITSSNLTRLEYARRLHTIALELLSRFDSSPGHSSWEEVTALRLSSQFCSMEGQMVASWKLAVRGVMAAFSIGLHQESKIEQHEPEKQDIQRHTWSCIYYWEKNISMTLDRPSVIQDELCTTLPFHIKEDSPTSSSHLVYLHSFAPLIGKVNRMVHSDKKEDDYRKVCALDAQICLWHDSLPSYFRSNTNQKVDTIIMSNESMDVKLPFLRLQRYVIETEVNTLRSALFRRFLPQDFAEHARKITVMCTLDSLALREEIALSLDKVYGVGQVPLHYGFHATMAKRLDKILTCCVILLHDPFHEKATSLRYHIEQYIALATARIDRYVNVNDPLSAKRLRREIRILQQFMKRVDARQELANAQHQEEMPNQPLDPFSVNIPSLEGFLPANGFMMDSTSNALYSANLDLSMVDFTFSQWEQFFSISPTTSQ